MDDDNSIQAKIVFERKTSKLVKNARVGFVIKVYAKRPENYEGEDIEIEWEDVRINAYMNSNEREQYLDAGYEAVKDPATVKVMSFGSQLKI